MQLKDQIKYFISTGALTAEEKLPPVKVLAKNLGINFLTVRKAYKELEESGLISIRHGEGSFISLGSNLQKNNAFQPDIQDQFAESIKQLVEQYSQKGLEFSEIKRISDETFAEIERSPAIPTVIFAECNQFKLSKYP